MKKRVGFSPQMNTNKRKCSLDYRNRMITGWNLVVVFRSNGMDAA